MNIERFEGWLIRCPFCDIEKYVTDEEIAFDPTKERHIVRCSVCGTEFEVYCED